MFLYRHGLHRFSKGLEWLLAESAWHLAVGERRLAIRQIQRHLDFERPSQAAAVSRNLVRHLARSMIEILNLWRGDKGVLERVQFSPGSRERLMEAMAGGRGVVYATGHLGNWELMAARIAATVPAHTITRQSYDPHLNRFVENVRRKYGIRPLDREDPELADKLKKLFEKGQLLGILMDQDTSVPGDFVPFFGRQAFTPSGAASIALKYEVPLLVGWVERGGADGRDHIVHVSEPLAALREADRGAEITRLTAACTRLLEDAIRQAPEQWVWFHERWKTRPEGE